MCTLFHPPCARFLSTPSVRRATNHPGQGLLLCRISIHALREEGDLFRSRPAATATVFLSTPSVRRATLISQYSLRCPLTFLSTPSVRRATTRTSFPKSAQKKFLSTPSVRRATAGRRNVRRLVGVFLSTPSVRRATDGAGRNYRPCTIFLSTPSVRRATNAWRNLRESFGISIHALREEGDHKQSGQHDGRPTFLSTPSVRRATCPSCIHSAERRDFYPRPP